MSSARLIFLTSLAMLAFAGNSLLCRMALAQTEIDAASFTSIRLLSGATVLWLLVRRQANTSIAVAGSWWSSVALFVYAAGFSYAYISLSTGTGALLLFGAVQLTMISYGFRNGERLVWLQWSGIGLAFLGLAGLLLPGVTAPPVLGSLLMLTAGVAWGVYSIRGRIGGSPVEVTAGNFVRSVPLAVLLLIIMQPWLRLDGSGVLYAVASGALASGLGYAIWYMALPNLNASTAAIVQLSVPVIAAFAGVVLLAEQASLRLLLASMATLGGIALVIMAKPARIS